MGINPNVEKWRPLVAKYFPPNEVENALRTMGGESGGDPRAHATNGENSRGLFQINLNAHPQLANVNLFDPETNVRVAAQMQQEQGWQPWSAARQLGIAGTTPLPGSGTGERKMAGPPTDAFWDQVQRHGGIVGTSVVNPTVKDPSGISGLPDTQNPSPTYRYVFADGTYLEGTTRATLDPQTNEWKVESVDITDPGTAMKASPSTATAQWSIQTKADGSKARVNEITGETAPLEGFGPKAPAPQMYTNRQRSDPGDSMSGPSQWNERVPVVDTRMNGRQLWGLPEGGTQYEMIQEFPDTSTGDPVGWANLTQRKQEFDQKMAWDRALAEMKAKQEREQADRTLQGQLYNHINDIWAKNLPRMGDPSQVYFAGANPGGPLETLYKQAGSAYDPSVGKINWQNFDPNAAWKQAAGMVRR